MFLKNTAVLSCLVSLIVASATSFANVVEVTVAANGDVRLLGDEFDNEVVIHANPNGSYYVFGLNGTQISFEGDKYVSWEDITLDGTSPNSNIKFDMGAGDDDLGIGAVTPLILEAKNVTGTMGKGDDYFTFLNARISRDVVVDGGPGGDIELIGSYFLRVDGNVRIRLSETESGNYSNGDPYSSGIAFNYFIVKNNVNILCGKGVHDVSLWYGQIDGRVDVNFGAGDVTGREHLDIYQTDIGKSLRVLQSSGASMHHLDDSNITGPTFVSLGLGNDEFASWMSDFHSTLTVNGSGGNDLLSLEFVNAFANVVFNGGTDHDDLIIDDSQLRGNVTLNGNAGDDYLGLHETAFSLNSVVRLNGHAGHDHVESISSLNALIWTLVINTASGDDSVIFNWNQFSATAGIRFYGGAGIDLLDTGSTVFNPTPFESGFEN